MVSKITAAVVFVILFKSSRLLNVINLIPGINGLKALFCSSAPHTLIDPCVLPWYPFFAAIISFLPV